MRDSELLPRDPVDGVLELKDVIERAMDRIAERAETGGHTVAGLASGLIDLDDITGGFQPGQLIILGGSTSMGKTALALGAVAHISIEAGACVLLVTREMAHLEIAERLLCSRSRVDIYKLRTGRGLGKREMTQLGKAFNDLSLGRLFIDDTPGRNLIEVSAMGRRLRSEDQLSMLVVDRIESLAPDPESPQDCGRVAAALKDLALELAMPILAMARIDGGLRA